MDDKYRQLIEAMAERLGTTAEHLWGILVKQAPISGAVDLVLCIVVAAAAVWFLQIVKRKTACPPKTKECEYPMAEWREEVAGVAWIGAFVAVAFAVVYIIVSAQGIVSAFANPEYWALKELICGIMF